MKLVEAHAAGIRVRMITGDHATTAAAIAAQLGIEGRALTGAEFAAMPDERLEAEIDPRNQGSARTLERQGFVLEGTLRARWCVAGELSDSGIYGLLLEPPVV